MRILSVQAENFMKFSRLRLERLPRSGVIGVEGPNESGKTTIGELLLFAFFGRTKRSKDCPLENLIHWGSEFLRVQVEFVVADGDGREETFLIFREIDRFGSNYAKVLELPGRRDVATGNAEVSAFVSRRLQCDFQEFQQAFYHDQYGSRRVDGALQEFVECLTGVKQMRCALSAIHTEIAQLEREFAHYQRDVRRNLKQIERYARGGERLAELRESALQAALEQERRKEKAAEQNRLQEARRRLLAQRESGERHLRELARATGTRFEEGVRDLLLEYGALERQVAGDEALNGNVRREIEAIRNALQQLEEVLRDYRELYRAIAEARETLEAELDEGSADSQQARLKKLESECDVLRQRAESGRRGSVWLALLVAAGAVTAVVSILSPGVLENARAIGRIPPVYIAGAGSAVALVSLALLVAKLVRVRALRAQEGEVLRSAVEVDRQLDTTRRRLDQFHALERIRESGEIAEYVHEARNVAKGATLRRLAEFEAAHGWVLVRKQDVSSVEGVEHERSTAGYRELLESLAEEEKQSRRRLQAVIQAESKTLKDGEAALRKAHSDRDRAENEIRECEAQSAKKQALEERNQELESRAAAIRAEIEDRQAACELLESCIATTQAKVGPALSSYMRGILPRLTGGRYREVKLDGRLEMQIFAADRCDFVRAVELSGGTNEALILALRLAAAQAFVTARTRQEQFLFLDEPFKMMDAPRVTEALKVLPHLSEDLRQVFVVQPRYTEAQRGVLDCIVQPSIEITELEIEFPSAS